MKTKTALFLVAALPLAMAGCATNEHYVQTGDSEQIISSQINIQDYANAANAAVNDLLASGALDRVSNPPAVVAVSRIVNNTGQQIDTDLLTERITKALQDSGKALTTSTDTSALGYQQENAFLNDQKNTRLPDFTLSGKIIETRDVAGDTTRTTYTFQFSLNDTKTGLQAWQDDKDIGKQGTRPAVGF